MDAARGAGIDAASNPHIISSVDTPTVVSGSCARFGLAE